MSLDPMMGSNFFGRRDILELLRKRVDGLRYGYRQNIAIFGPPYYGKTSVVRRFIDGLPFHDVVPIYVEVKSHGFFNFAEKFISSLLFRYLNNIDRIPKTAKAVKTVEALIKNGKMLEAYSAIFELPAIAYGETGLRPIVILDEFHRIEDFGIGDAFVVLGKNIMFQKDTMYIVTSSQTKRAKNILSEKLSLLFGNFEICELDTFDVSCASDFINFRLRGKTLSKELSDFLI